jgi:excisionase family DNA binding protein
MNAPTLTYQPTLLSPREAAQRLGVSRRWIYRQAHGGELPFFRLGDSPNAPLRVDSDDLAEWVQGLKKLNGSDQPIEQSCH